MRAGGDWEGQRARGRTWGTMTSEDRQGHEGGSHLLVRTPPLTISYVTELPSSRNLARSETT